jgi:hypothetical protein
MRSRRIIGWAALLAVLMFVPNAGAAVSSPRQIYADFAAHGKLDGRYTRAELEAALRDALAEGYRTPAASGVEPAVEAQLRTPAARSSLPFTGADLALIGLGGGTLLLLGAGLRRLGRVE